MIDLFDLWISVAGEANIHQGGMIKPMSQLVDWANAISDGLFEEKFAGAWEKNQKISDDLAFPFLRSVVRRVSERKPTYGLLTKPDDYAHLSSLRFYHKDEKCVEVSCEKEEELPEDVSERTIKPVPNGRWGAITEHRSKYPTFKRPYASAFDEGFKIMPKEIDFVVMDYLRKPKKATFVYTVGSDDQIIYNKAASQPLEWSSLVVNEFITRLKEKFGVFTREPFIYQTSERQKATTV